MSYKIVDAIKKTRGVPGRIKRVLEAYASFADKDGTNIFASKEAVARRAGVSRDTVYRNTEDCLRIGVLVPARNHTCRQRRCNKGMTHFTGTQGHYTCVYFIDLALLQNAETQVSAKCRKDYVAKCRKVHSAKSDTTRSLKDPAPLTTFADDPSATRSVAAMNERMYEGFPPPAEENLEPPEVCEQENLPVLQNGEPCTDEVVLDHLRRCFPAYRTAMPSPEDYRLMREVVVTCDEGCCYPSDLVAHAERHNADPRYVPRSVRRLHAAVCGPNVSVTDSLLQRHKRHCAPDCRECRARLKDAKCQRCGKQAAVQPDGTATYCSECLRLTQQRVRAAK